ncbi:hypothetical protein DMN91_001832 [Ooceraea biroi]|uniref:Uncharacterized protein n=1 Tax=Ooceraea biroi TaxID=2015173 RepID=A0A3L8DZW5_OOCBI|nr:hypothetical protein DMN91_001832 [Ooceraea biroi]
MTPGQQEERRRLPGVWPPGTSANDRGDGGEGFVPHRGSCSGGERCRPTHREG